MDKIDGIRLYISVEERITAREILSVLGLDGFAWIALMILLFAFKKANHC